MCGIAAIFAYQASAPGVDVGELTVIRDQMTARGPDGCGNWLDANRRIGLGHRRLAIIDLSEAGAQPMHFEQFAILFNGEIYNYRELRAGLEARGHVFKSNCDTEVLLHLYAEKGRAMTDALRGMYAFALWDGAQRGLFIARDPYGIKPLYLADDGKTLRVASQVKALLAGGRVDTSPEPAGHVGFFLWGHVPDPFTLYRGIRSLPAGSSLWLDDRGNKKQETFCSIPSLLRSSWGEGGRRPDEVVLGSGAGLGVRASSEVSSSSPISAFSFQLSEFLRDSVAHHLIADVPVGVFLSSGLDSTTLAALAAEQGGQLRTVTLGFEEYRGTANDEAPLAELVAKQYGAQHRTIWISRRDFETEAENLFTAMDRPSTDGVNTYFVSLAAKRAGLKVALSGLGGDELFGGYPSFTQIPRTVRALGSMHHAPWLGRAFRVVTAPMLKHFTSPKYAGLLEYGGTYGGAYLLRRGMYMPWELSKILDADLVREGWAELNTLAELNATASLLRLDQEESDATLAHWMGEGLGVRASGGCSTPSSVLHPPVSSRLRLTALESCWYMRHQLLRDSDWAGMAHSLEIRVPLVDTTLLRSLLPALGSDTPPTKRDMAAAPRSPLPAAVLNRSKTGFTIPVRDWMRKESPESKVQRPKSGERGLRGWARYVHSRFPGSDCVLATKGKSRKPGAENGNEKPEAGSQTSGRRILALVSDAFGGHGGIAKFNRDLLSALCSDPNVSQVVAIPRLVPEPTGALPKKLEYATRGARGKLHFALAAIRSAWRMARGPADNGPVVIICGHINLLPLAFLARRLMSLRNSFQLSPFRDVPPIALIIHGIDAWQATRSAVVNRLVRKLDVVIAVSEFTRKKFWAWAQPERAQSFILRKCVELMHFTPGPKQAEVLTRYGLGDKTVLLTVARLSAQERYKGIDEVMEVLPALAKEIPNLCYLIVGDGTDRARLIAKAKSLGLTVRDRSTLNDEVSSNSNSQPLLVHFSGLIP